MEPSRPRPPDDTRPRAGTGRPGRGGRLRALGPEASRFLTVGLCGLGTNLLCFNVLNRPWSGLGVVSAGMLATLAGVLVTYVGNRWWTYRGRVTTGTRGVFLRFMAFSCVGLLIENGVLALGHYGLGADTRLADNGFKLLGLVLGTAFRFVSYRSWVFRRPATGAARQQPGRRPTGASAADFDGRSARGADRAGRG